MEIKMETINLVPGQMSKVWYLIENNNRVVTRRLILDARFDLMLGLTTRTIFQKKS